MRCALCNIPYSCYAVWLHTTSWYVQHDTRLSLCLLSFILHHKCVPSSVLVSSTSAVQPAGLICTRTFLTGRSSRLFGVLHFPFNSSLFGPCFVRYETCWYERLSLCVIEHHYMKAYRRVEVQLHSFLNIVLGGGEW